MLNIIFEIDVAGLLKTKGFVELFEIKLRPDTDGVFTKNCVNSIDGSSH